MGNKIASELVSALRLSTLGTTLCSRTDARSPALVDIGNFPGVAKAFVFFDGDDDVTIDNNCYILRSYNISSVVYLGTGIYKVIFNDQFLNYGLENRYVINGCVRSSEARATTAANAFFVMNSNNNTLRVSTSSFVIHTQITSKSGVSAANARSVYLTIF